MHFWIFHKWGPWFHGEMIINFGAMPRDPVHKRIIARQCAAGHCRKVQIRNSIGTRIGGDYG